MSDLTNADFAQKCAYISGRFASWAGDLLTLPERRMTPADVKDVARFTDSIRDRLNHLDRTFGRSTGGIQSSAATSNWRPIAEADKDIAYIIDLPEDGLRIGNSYPVWVRDEDGRTYEALWSDNGKTAYWWDIEGESPVDPVEFLPHPLDPRFAAANCQEPKP